MTTPTEQNQSLILEAMKQNRNRILFFLSLVTYCLLAVLATTDRDLFFATGIKLPLLGVELPLLAFYIVMPVFIILTHFNVLYLFNKHIKNLKKINSNSDSNKFLSAGIFDFIALSKGDPFQKIIKEFVFFVLYFLPLITLSLFWFYFIDYQDLPISILHICYLIVDIYIVVSFIRQEFKYLISEEFEYLISALFTFVFIAIIVQIAIAIDILPKKWYPRLSLSGEQLVNFDRNQLLVLQNLDKEKHNSLAFYQPAFDLNNRSFKYADFSYSTLININFSNANLQKTNLSKAQLQGANLRGAELQGANLRGAELQGANLHWAELQGANLDKAQLQVANLYRAQLQGANLTLTELQGANLTFAQLQGANLYSAKLQGANLRRANLDKAQLQVANLYEANLYEADLRLAKLQGADLYRAKLQGADLTLAQLQGANLREAQLQVASLREAQLQGADLIGAQLQGASLRRAQLQGASLRRAQLQGVDLYRAKLQGANLYKTQLQGTYVDDESLNYLNFVKRINKQTDKETDTDSLKKQYKPLDAQRKKLIIAELTKIKSFWIEGAIERIENASDALDLSGAKTGSYDKQQAQQWIKQYKKDTLNAKKWTD